MKVLILNSGMGTRMGVLTSDHPKCMTEISNHETILSRQLNMVNEAGLTDAIITTGYNDGVLVNYVQSLGLPLNIKYVKNEKYDSTNYIYSIYCARDYLDDDIILMHGDMVFESSVFDEVLSSNHSVMTVSTTVPLPEKDFKAVVKGNAITAVGINYFSEAFSAQPIYMIRREDWKIWLDKIVEYIESNEEDKRKCYAENAFNEVSSSCKIAPLDVKDRLCNEVDNPEDLAVVLHRLNEIENRTVYMCFSTDILHGGHINIIKKAQKLGKLIIGVMSDEAVASYKRYPLLSYEDRKMMFSNITGVWQVVKQESLSYRDNIEKYKPTYVVHGDDYCDYNHKIIQKEREKHESEKEDIYYDVHVEYFRPYRMYFLIIPKSYLDNVEYLRKNKNDIFAKGKILTFSSESHYKRHFKFDAVIDSQEEDPYKKGVVYVNLVPIKVRYRYKFARELLGNFIVKERNGDLTYDRMDEALDDFDNEKVMKLSVKKI